MKKFNVFIREAVAYLQGVIVASMIVVPLFMERAPDPAWFITLGIILFPTSVYFMLTVEKMRWQESYISVLEERINNLQEKVRPVSVEEDTTRNTRTDWH